MGLFGKIFGKEEKKESCCCEMEIVELPEGDIAAPCDCGDACDAPGAESITLTVLGPGCKRCHQRSEEPRERPGCCFEGRRFGGRRIRHRPSRDS